MMAEKYNNPTKDTWRGWAWNQIADRKVMPGETVMVLCGDGAFDYEVGRKKGFNVVGVDVAKHCVNIARNKGGVAICDTLQNQIVTIKPKAVIADMLGGCTSDTLATLFDAIGLCDVVVANLLRGRDRGIQELPGCIPSYKGRVKSMVPIGRHRGRISLVYLLTLMHQPTKDSPPVRRIPWEEFESFKPSYYTYKSKDSKKLHYDSLAITTRHIGIRNYDDQKLLSTIPKSSRRKAAAAKALLTMQRERN
jgi:hypothetical protein